MALEVNNGREPRKTDIYNKSIEQSDCYSFHWKCYNVSEED